MKRLNLLFLSFAVIGLLFTGCEDVLDGDALGPSLEITSTNHTANGEGEVTISWRANAGDANLDYFSIINVNTAVIDVDGVEWKQLDIPNSENEAYVGSATIKIAETTTFTLRVVDKDNLIEQVDVTATLGEQSTPLSSYTATLLGAQSNATEGSFLDAETESVYTVSAAIVNQEDVDIIFYYGASNFASLAAPNDAGVNEFSGFGLSTWTTKNATVFGELSGVDFASLDTDEDLKNVVGTLSATSATQLSVGDVVAFETVEGKLGVLKVSAIDATASGSITFDYKIEQ